MIFNDWLQFLDFLNIGRLDVTCIGILKVLEDVGDIGLHLDNIFEYHLLSLLKLMLMQLVRALLPTVMCAIQLPLSSLSSKGHCISHRKGVLRFDLSEASLILATRLLLGDIARHIEQLPTASSLFLTVDNRREISRYFFDWLRINVGYKIRVVITFLD